MENKQDWQGILEPDLGERIAAIVETQVAKSLEGLNIEAEIRRDLEDLDINALVHAEVEKALSKIEFKLARAHDRLERAREKAHRASEKLARHQEKMRRAAEQMAHRHERAQYATPAHHIDVSTDTPVRMAAKPHVSEEEQLSVLHMLEEGRITPEQADMLLNALAG